MSLESKVDALRIKLAMALNWLDVPGVTNDNLIKVAMKAYYAEATSDNVEHTLFVNINRACKALHAIQQNVDERVLPELVQNLRYGVDTVESCLKSISPSRIDVISNELK